MKKGISGICIAIGGLLVAYSIVVMVFLAHTISPPNFNDVGPIGLFFIGGATIIAGFAIDNYDAQPPKLI